MNMLPKQWCVKRNTDNYQVLNKWCNSQEGVSGTNAIDGWIHSINYGSNGWGGFGHYLTSINKHSKHVEISFEEFKEYVLGEDFPLVKNKKLNYNYLIPIIKIINKNYEIISFKK